MLFYSISKFISCQIQLNSFFFNNPINVNLIVLDIIDAINTQGNESAKRTLVRLSQKLKGVEKGTPLSVNGQVNLLIQQAKDPTNLCRMYYGWKPHA